MKRGSIRLVVTICCVLVTSCQSSGLQSSYSDTLSALFMGKGELPSQEFLDNSDRDVLWAFLGKGRAGGLVRVNDGLSDERWVSGSYRILKIRHGRIIGTTRLLENISGFRSSEADPLPNMYLLESASFSYQMDFSDLGLSQVEFDSVLTRKEKERVRVGNKMFLLFHIEETISNEHLGFSARNDYWVSIDNGRVLKTRQCFIEDMGCFSLEYLKRAP